MTAVVEKRQIYLDNAATTSVYPEVIEIMSDCLRDNYGNPSTLYSIGDTARLLVSDARDAIAKTLGCLPDEIYFTSGGSESDNWVIKGIADAYRYKGRHIITTSIEHKAILKSCNWLEKHGFEVSYIEPDDRGYIKPESVESLIRDDTILVSVMMANNEIGTIEPIGIIGEICEEHGVLFHTDAVQAYGHININVDDLHVSLLSASGHKFHGPKGIGFLYIRNGISMPSFISGGGQENGLRAGTENVPGIVGMGVAAQLSNENVLRGVDVQTASVRDYFINKVLEDISGASLNGTLLNRLPNNISFSFKGINASTAVGLLSEMGVFCSAGSACNNGDPKPSHVLTAIGKTEQEAQSTLRFSIDESTTKDDVDYAVKMIKTAVELLR